MAILVHRYDAPDRFVAGTVGQPGERTFFLQAREGNRITSVACEKQQVSVLAEHLDRVLDEIVRRGAAKEPASVGLPSARDIAGLDAVFVSGSPLRGSRQSGSRSGPAPAPAA